MRDLFFVCDVETDANTPMQGSMLTIGCKVVANSVPMGQSLDGEYYTVPHQYYSRLKRREGFGGSKDTLEWWAFICAQGGDGAKAYYEAFDYDADRYNPIVAMARFDTWVKTVCPLFGPDINPVFVSSPAAFDFMWVRFYLEYYVGSCVFGHRALDLRSLHLGMDPKIKWSEGLNLGATFLPGTRPKLEHHALHDAEHLADVFVAMMNIRSKGKTK